MGCVTGIVRTVMFVFNFACLAVGIVLIAVGSVFYISVDQYDKILEESSGLNVVPSLTIAVGVIVFVIAFLGCCGAIKNSSCMLTTYAVILIVLLIVQLTAGIIGVVKTNNEDDLKDEVMKGMRDGFKKYKDEKTVRDVFQSLQSSLECCGVDGPNDYQSVLDWNIGEYAGGCCGKPNEEKCPTSSLPHSKGCGKKFFDVIHDGIKIVAIVALAICGVELLGAIFAICLVKSK